MRRILLFFVCILLLVSCREENSVYYYSLYGKNDLLIEKNKYKQTISEIQGGEYHLKISGKGYDENFKIKLDSSGLYRYCDKHYIITHHFDSIGNQSFCRSSPPFIFKKVYWVKKKRYLIGNRFYEVICFSENSGSETSCSSYYLKGFGFICYYFNKVDKYILCDSISNTSLKIQTLRKINSILVHDTSTFERYAAKRIKVKFLPPD